MLSEGHLSVESDRYFTFIFGTLCAQAENNPKIAHYTL